MDKERDLYIKEFFEKDQLISKKANDVFDNFFKEELNMKEEQENKKVVEFESVNSKEKNKKKIHKRRILTAVASCAVIFVGANVYATTKGYENIFFMIRDLTKTKQTTQMSDILEDRDILISYKPIDIANGVKIQINELVLKDGKGKLYVRVDIDSGENENIPAIYKVYDVDNNDKLLGKLDASEEEYIYGGAYSEEILLENIKNNTNKLKLELLNKENQEITTILVDLKNKEVIVGEGKEKEIQKISEVELKKILGEYVLLNIYKDENYAENNDIPLTKEQWMNGQMVSIATDLIYNKYTEKMDGTFKVEDVNKAIKEFLGKEINGPLDMAEGFGILVYNKNTKKYEYLPGDGLCSAMCLEIENISFADDVYSVTFTYCYPTEGDYVENTIEYLAVYRTTMKFKLNDEYEYTKYCLVDVDKIKSEKIKENTIEEKYNNVVNETSTTIENVNNAVSNSNSEYNNSNTNYNTSSNNSTNITSNSKTNNTINNNSSGNTNNTKVDNYASTMKWRSYSTLGLKLEYPEIFDLVEPIGQTYTSVITGVATGINPDTKEIINSNMSIKIYKPRITDVDNELDYYRKVISEELDIIGNVNNFYGYKTNSGIKWYQGNLYNENDRKELYINYSTTDEGVHVGRMILISYDKPSFKVTNIENRLFATTQLDDSQISSFINDSNFENNESSVENDFCEDYIIENEIFEIGKVYNVYYFNQNGNYKSYMGECIEKGKLRFLNELGETECKIKVISEDGNSENSVYNVDIEVRYDENGKLKK